MGTWGFIIYSLFCKFGNFLKGLKKECLFTQSSARVYTEKVTKLVPILYEYII